MRVLVAFSIMVLCVAGVSNPARAGVLEFLFPGSAPREPDPSQTLRAPFAPSDAEPSSPELGQLPDAIGAVKLQENTPQQPLDKPHLPAADIAEWVQNSAAGLLTFKKDGLRDTLAAHQDLFEDSGTARRQYLVFLRDQRIASQASDKGYDVRSYAYDVPILQNEGVVGASYRWLYSVPVMVSYMPVGHEDYTNNASSDGVITQKAVLDIQVGRVLADNKPNGLQIEQWSGELRSFDPTAQ